VERFTLIYDADCGFCRWSVDKILAWDRRRRLRPLALQDPEADRLLAGMTSERRMASWHLAWPDGRIRSGGYAVPGLARLLPGARPIGAVASTFPKTTDRLYRFFAGHRDGLAKLVGARACAVDPTRRTNAPA
jgi:predicted DCC family thiol-disulfide oxidoreductase YuxK